MLTSPPSATPHSQATPPNDAAKDPSSSRPLGAMAIEIPPGILYLLHHSPRLLFPPLVVCILNYVSSSGILPTYTFALFPFKTASHLVTAMIASIPLALCANIWWDEVKIRVEARRLGAVLPPRIKDWWPGGIGLVLRQTKAMKTGYLGECYLLLWDV
jgi:hypothetical protein